jgi:hypothetical protein
MTKTAAAETPDLLASVEQPKRKTTPVKKGPKPEPKPKASTAVAVDDPAKRRQVAQPRDERPPSKFLEVVMRAAADPACDPAKMHSLLDFQERLKKAEAKEDFDEAFVALQAELPSIRRDRKIEVRAKDSKGERTGKLLQSTPYATFENIMAAVQPLLTKHGFGLSFETKPMDPIIVGESVMERILVKGILSRRGHERTSEFAVRPDNSGSKNATQAQGSGQSYGKRYCAIALLNIVSHAPEDADSDGRPGDFKHGAGNSLVETGEVETLTDEETAQLNRKAIDCKVPIEKIFSHYDVRKLSDVPRSLFHTAMKQCDDYADNQKRVRAGGQPHLPQDGFPGDRPRGR